MTAKFEKYLTSCQHCLFFHQPWKERSRRLQGLPAEESRLRWASDTCQKTTPWNDHMYSPRLWCHESELHVGPGGRSRAAGLAAALPPALLEGEDDALVDGAAFQLAVGLAGLLHGHGFVRAQAEPASGQQGDRLIQGTGSTVGGVLGERDAEVSGSRVRQGDDPPGSASQGDRVGQGTLAGRIEHGVHRAQRANPVGQARAVAYRRRSQLARERFVVLADRELRRDDADGSAAAEQQQRLTPLYVQLPEHTYGHIVRTRN